MDSAKFVLARFTAAEREQLETVLSSAAAAVDELESGSLDAVMNRYNPKA
jgi:peptidyl-tRNA hydrolase